MLVEYTLSARGLCLGERLKKGTFRGTLERSIPYSQLTGALWARFGSQVESVGIIKKYSGPYWQKASVRDRAAGVARLPLEFAVLVDVEARVFVPEGAAGVLPEEFHIQVGALRSKGLGLCTVSRHGPVSDDERRVCWGALLVRLPERQNVLERFGVTEVAMPVWGYMFEPDEAHIGGRYVRALFEGSVVKGPRCLVDPEGGE